MRNIIVENNEKYKSVLVSINMLLPLKGENNSKNALLAQMLKKCSRMFPNEKELEIALANLYNTKIDVDVEKLDNLYNIRFSMEILNSNYISEEELKYAKDILLGIILKPNIVNGEFSSEVFEREKQSLIERIKEEKDDKKRYALKELEKDMFCDTEYTEGALGRIEDVEKITNKELSDYYNEAVNEAQFMIATYGNLKGMEKLPQEILDSICEKCGKHEVKNKTDVENSHEIIKREEKQQIAQSIICIGLKARNVKKEDMYKLIVCNSILGGTPSSKLFQNVREKESLAYFAKAMYNRHKNAVYMFAGIDPKNHKKAEDIMLKQVEIIKAGDVSEIEFNAAKQNILHGYEEIEDSKELTIRQIINNEIFFDKQVTTEQMISNIEKVTLTDVIEISKKLEVTNIFLLGGVANV